MNAMPVRTLGVAGVAVLAALSPAVAIAHPDSGAGSARHATSALVLRSVPEVGTTTTASGFDWSAAGIGAVTVTLAGSLALTAGAVIRRKPAGLWS